MNRKWMIGFSLSAGILLIIVLALFIFWKLLAPFILSYVIYFILRPALHFLEQRGIPHTWSVCLVFFSILGGLALFMAFFIPALFAEFSNITNNLHSYSLSINSFLDSVRYSLNSLPFGSSLADMAAGIFSPSPEKTAAFFQSAAQKIPSFLSTLLLFVMVIPFATFFFLLDGRRLSHTLISIVPNRFFEATLNLMFHLNQQFGLILRGMLISVFIVSLLSSLGLWIIHLKFPILIGVFAGFSNLIPYAGPVVGIAAACIAAVMTGSPLDMFIYILVVFFIVQAIDNILLQPLVMAKSANLHPLFVLFLVFFGSSFGGFAGMLVIVPAVSLSLVIFRTIFSELNRPPRPSFSAYRDISSEKNP